jgi:hypothetical protein
MEADRRQVIGAALAAFVAFVPACRSPRGATGAASPLEERLLALPAELIPDHPNDAGEVREEVDAIVFRVREAFAKSGSEGGIEAMNHELFDVEGWEREVEDKDLAYVLLPSVLRGRRGSCVGLGTLYLVLAERLGIEMRGVVVPGHFFVRVREGAGWRNVELLRRGEQEPEEWYAARWPAPTTTTDVYGRLLTTDEVVGVVEYDVGNESRRAGRLAAARRSFERAVRHFPTLPEAQASLGAVLQLTGDLDAAAAAYAAARRLAPGLSGLAANEQLLEAERQDRRRPQN